MVASSHCSPKSSLAWGMEIMKKKGHKYAPKDVEASSHYETHGVDPQSRLTNSAQQRPGYSISRRSKCGLSVGLLPFSEVPQESTEK